MEFKLKSKSSKDLQGFSCSSRCGSKYLQRGMDASEAKHVGLHQCSIHLLASKKLPPSCAEVRLWFSDRKDSPSKRSSDPAETLKMDPNTGQFIEEMDRDPFSLEASGMQSGSFVVTPSSPLQARPASPKYDEQAPLHLLDSLHASKMNDKNFGSTPVTDPQVHWELPFQSDARDGGGNVNKGRKIYPL